MDPQLLFILEKHPIQRNEVEKKKLAKILMNIKFFKEQNFKDHELVVFCDKLRLLVIEADKYVFKHGNFILF